MALSFAGNGTITGLSVGGLPDGCIDSDTLSAGTGGKVLQVLQNVKTDTQSISGNTFTTVLTQAITPAATSSKVLIHVNLNVTGSVRYSAVKLYRDSTQIFLGDASSNRAQVSVASLINESASSSTDMMYHSSFVFLDSPSSSSEVIYYVKCANTYTGSSYGTGATTYINRTPTDTDSNYSHRGASSLIAQEISA
jgi:hypothetical protein